MSFVTDFSNPSYIKTTGISLFLHSVLLVAVLLLKPFASAEQPPVAAVIEVVPAVVSDKDDKASSLPPTQQTVASPPPPMAQKSSQAPMQQSPQTPMPNRTLPAALPQEPNETPVAQATSVGTITGYIGAPYGVTGAAEGTGIERATDGGSGGSRQDGTGGSSGGQAGAVGSGGGKRTGASWRYNPKPSYPEGARQAGWEGSVVLHIRIETDGSVTVLSAHSDRSDASNAAVQKVSSWCATPAHDDDGTPIVSYKDIRVTFNLSDK